MGAVKSQLETSHQEDLNDLTARYLAETAIKVETTRLETEHEWQEKLNEMKEKHELELQTMGEKLSQVSTAGSFSICENTYRPECYCFSRHVLTVPNLIHFECSFTSLIRTPRDRCDFLCYGCVPIIEAKIICIMFL